MWTYDARLGLAMILYESLTGKFLGYFNAECIGRYITPQRAARAISRLFTAVPAHAHSEIPTNINLWQAHHQPEFEAGKVGATG